MGKLTGTRYGDAANELFAFYQDKASELEEAGQYYMAAIALAFALETVTLTYLLVEFGEENGGELEIPDRVERVKFPDSSMLCRNAGRMVAATPRRSRGYV